jgi:hypothetical protein
VGGLAVFWHPAKIGDARKNANVVNFNALLRRGLG